MKSALIIAFGVVAISAVYQHEKLSPRNSGASELEDELSLVQMEEMRVISPDRDTAARL